jgi:hypothetical protein
VKPPVLWPASRHTREATATPVCVRAASSLSPPRETQRVSASSLMRSTASSASSSPALRSATQPCSLRRSTAWHSISRAAADRLGARPRLSSSWSARIG